MRAAALFPWFSPVSSLKFVGPAVTEALGRLLRPTRMVEEVQSRDPVIRDLLFHLPVGVIDRRVVQNIADAKAGDYATFEVEIIEHVPPPRSRRKIPYRVVARDADLAGDVQRDLLERMAVGHPVDEGDDDVQARRQRGVVAPQALDDPRVLLGDDLDRLDDEDHGDHEKDGSDFHGGPFVGGGRERSGRYTG